LRVVRCSSEIRVVADYRSHRKQALLALQLAMSRERVCCRETPAMPRAR